MASATTKVDLAPSPGFCVKSTTQNSAATKDAAPITIPSGLKVFVNIAWDANVPPPPDGSDAAIERAMSDSTPVDADQALQWFVPVIVSEPRPDTDKAGKPSVVFDCIFNSSLKSRALRSPEFKTFLIELAFQRIEAQYSLLLSRQIGTPNITSKGKLKPRTVLVPTSLLQGTTLIPTASTSSSRPLIEELPASTSTPAAPPKGILKKSSAYTTPTSTSPAAPSTPQAEVPGLSWSRTPDGRLRIALSVPHLTRTSISSTTLDIEPRRIIFEAPGQSAAPSRLPKPSSASAGYALDLDLSASDADILALFASSGRSVHMQNGEESGRSALTLKRERALDVDGATAEWRVAEGLLVIYA
ncbi:hypothetical protein L227DRAFT_81444 [Lentinus tigrinus ALCF2SS1-6]|uniref:PIH1 N-terminal domain-containing protein n=1 Tax=Lentinus tigrinus ALCF2SS1-6 TaxID=1328759 RepID=A0A5C2SC74_9APHY|nr:hypothetical protein L227DRAFT_81444 [Lentinus tigrinus ALCF2SS1-6]